MKKYIIRVIALVVLFLNMEETKAALHKFLIPASGEIQLESFKDFLRAKGNPTQNTWWTAPSTGQKIYIKCNPVSYRNYMNLSSSEIDQLIVVDPSSIDGQYYNTGWSDAGTIENIGAPGSVLANYRYFAIGREAKAKTNCGNPQNIVNKTVIPAPIATRKLYVPCYNKEVEMASVSSSYSKDSNLYLHSTGDWYYFTGKHLAGGKREFKKVSCEPEVQTQTIVKTQVVEKVVYIQNPEPITTYQQMPAQSTMGRVYRTPGWWEAPPMPNYPVRQRSFNLSIGLMLMPNVNRSMYNWYPVPGNFYQGQQVYQGSPFYAGNPPVYSAGNPFYTSNNQYYNQNPSGGGPFSGGGYTPGVAQRVP